MKKKVNKKCKWDFKEEGFNRPVWWVKSRKRAYLRFLMDLTEDAHCLIQDIVWGVIIEWK